MARPWEGKNYSKEEMEKNYGPETAPGGITREQFYDRMVANGWNRKGDDEIITAMYWLGCHNLNAVSTPDGMSEVSAAAIINMTDANKKGSLGG